VTAPRSSMALLGPLLCAAGCGGSTDGGTGPAPGTSIGFVTASQLPAIRAGKTVTLTAAVAFFLAGLDTGSADRRCWISASWSTARGATDGGADPAPTSAPW
jgi:hypothetical protein